MTEKQKSGDMWIFLWWGLESRSASASNLSHIQSLASTHPPPFYSTAQFQMGHWMVKSPLKDTVPQKVVEYLPS